MSKKRRKGTGTPPPRYRKGKAPRSARPQEGTPPQAGAAAQPGPAEPSRAQPAVADAAAPAARPAPRAPGRVLALAPLAPLIVRSGRPFDDQAGADGARFPPPSTLAGCLRTAYARQQGKPFGPELAAVAVSGPLLLAPGADGRDGVLVPKPADALYFGKGAEARMVRAAPRPLERHCGSDLPAGLWPVQLAQAVAEKPGQGPAWWRWEDLIAFRRGQDPDHAGLTVRGWSPPAGDLRTHVAIDPATGAAAGGKLFQTRGLDLEPDLPYLAAAGADGGRGPRLLARCAEPLAPGLAHLGGERRLAAIEPEAEACWPQPPEGWFQAIRDAGGLSLTLLTPGLFGAGYRPAWLDQEGIGVPPGCPGLRLQLQAAALERWQPQSGWDLAAEQPRAARKLVPAGATYWFRLLDAGAESGAEPGAHGGLGALWLAAVCDDPQDRRDGFGLALPAPWTPPASAGANS